MENLCVLGKEEERKKAKEEDEVEIRKKRTNESPSFFIPFISLPKRRFLFLGTVA